MYLVAEKVQLLTAIRVVPLLVSWQVGDVINLSLVQPFDKQFECFWVLVKKLDFSVLDLLMLSVDVELFVEVLCNIRSIFRICLRRRNNGTDT